jgi:radical SAM-linked protein
MRTMERLFRRAELPLAMSQGYHPKPRMTFPLALALGIAGENEVMELELAEALSAEELQERLVPQAPPGLQFRAIEVLPEGSRKARARSASYEAPIPEPRQAGLDARIAALLSAVEFPVRRPARPQAIDVRSAVEDVAFAAGQLRLRLRTGPGPMAGPRDVLAALGLDDLEQAGVCLTRTDVEIDS